MLTPEQENWVAHLSDQDKIIIVPFDPTAEEKFKKVKQRIQNVLGKHVSIEHHGATSLGISGQDEIDVYIPVSQAKFDSLVDSLKGIFGEPKSMYPLERARFATKEVGKHVDVFLINEEHDGWKNALKFEANLKANSAALNEYRQLKESGNGANVKEYYRRKIEYINRIISNS
jgi:GrpB-like predicted nucleotidyltransferase (UPF0157 family)